MDCSHKDLTVSPTNQNNGMPRMCKFLFIKTAHTAYNFMCIPAHQTLTLSDKETAHRDFYVTD